MWHLFVIIIFHFLPSDLNKKISCMVVILFKLTYNCPSVIYQNNLDELFMLMHFLDAGKVSFINI